MQESESLCVAAQWTREIVLNFACAHSCAQTCTRRPPGGRLNTFLLACFPTIGETVYEGGGQSDWVRTRETVRGGGGGGFNIVGELVR
jgi:hypothetical protein